MEERIQNLYQKLRDISALYLIYRMQNNVEQVKKIIPEIQDFVLWFLDGNRFGIEEGLYQGMCQNIIVILDDILQAMKQEDIVLLHDAVAYGLMEYLQLFVEEEQEEGTDDSL
ncbi:MAG: hypothetical protein HFH49_03525 [Lachnospiraceae bacterium]|nr:hypothetical protein [Lachnospiraceae bacterium]